MPDTKHTLYIIACAAPPAQKIQELVELAIKKWTVIVVATPEATKFVDIPLIEELTGYPVRSTFKRPNEPDILPKPESIIVCPATFNTINKWVLGINDTLALGILNEALGSGLPIVAVPCLKDSLAKHPVFYSSLELLKEAGVKILYEPEKYQSPAIVPWEDILTIINSV